jgi:hypothetical protein
MKRRRAGKSERWPVPHKLANSLHTEGFGRAGGPRP